MRAAVVLLVTIAGAASAGPVVVYREGPQFCPRDCLANIPGTELGAPN